MKTKPPHSGFTLIETLIALVVLSVALAAMVPMLVYTNRANAFGRDTTLAANYAQDEMERLKMLQFDTSGTHADLAPGTHVDPNPPPTGYTRTWTVANSGGLYGADLIGIEVTTTWTDVRGLAHPSSVFCVRARF